MSTLLTTLLLVAGACLLLGMVAGWALSALRTEADETGKEFRPEEEAPPGGKKGNYTSDIHLWRAKKGGRLIVEMGGKAYVAPDPLSPEERVQLANTAQELASWVGMPIPSPVAAPQNPLPEVAVQRSSVEAIPAAIFTSAEIQSSAVEVNPPAASGMNPPTPLIIPSAQKPINRETETVFPVAPKSMVMQINDVLQELLVGTPYFSSGISLVEDLQIGVIVWVGLKRYEGIDSVPDPQIQQLVRAAVSEWERRQEDTKNAMKK